MFGIFYKGSGRQKTMISTEGARHYSNAVVSQIHYYLKTICPRAGTAEELYFHMDSCDGKSKKRIFLGYFLPRVLHEHHNRIVLQHMTVGHTNFGPDQVFGQICQRMYETEALAVREFMERIVENAAEYSNGFLSDHYTNIRDYKHGKAKLFNSLLDFSVSSTVRSVS